MSINYPTSLDTLTNPTATDSVVTVSHASQHANANDAIEALEAKVGINSSAVTTSHDYKLSGVTGSDKAASLSGTETLYNKTLSGAVVTEANLNMADNTTANVSTSRHGFAPKAPNDTNQFLRGDGNWGTVAANVTVSQITPLPDGGGAYTALQNINSNTVFHVGRVVIPFTITAASVSIYASAASTPGTVKVAMYTETGSTKIFEVTTASISGAGTKTTTISPSVAISPGTYYIGVLSQSTANVTLGWYERGNAGNQAMADVSTKAKPYGTLTVTADTIPATIDPTAITVTGSNTNTIIATLQA